MLKENLESVEEKIQEACKKSGRNREDVTLVAVSKTKPVETLQEAYDLGDPCLRREQSTGTDRKIRLTSKRYTLAYDRSSAAQ